MNSSKRDPRIVILGGTGYAGSVFHDFLHNGLGIKSIAIPKHADLDITQFDSLYQFFQLYRPDVILNLAAKVNTDWCEENFYEAYAINVEGALNVVRAGLACNARVVHFSTACLYPDNKKYYCEIDEIRALCKYTETKFLAEKALQPYEGDILNIRMRQLFSNHRHPRNLLEKLASYRQLIDEPNSMSHLEACIPVIWGLVQKNVRGPLNITNPGWTTPFEIAKLIKQYWQPNKEIAVLSYEALLANLRAVRVNSLVDCSRLESLGYQLLPVKTSIINCLLHPCDLGKYAWV